MDKLKEDFFSHWNRVRQVYSEQDGEEKQSDMAQWCLAEDDTEQDLCYTVFKAELT